MRKSRELGHANIKTQSGDLLLKREPAEEAS